MTFVRSLLLVLGLTGALAAQAANGFAISGVVVDEGSRRPIGGAKLVLLQSQRGMDSRKLMVAGADGQFRFAGLTPGKYNLMGEADGYPQQGLNAREQYVTAVVVGPGKDSEHVVFALRREARVSGTVTDEAGEPVRDAQVALLRKETVSGQERVMLPRGFAQTDDLGRYKIRGLPAGQYFIAVVASPWYADDGGNGPRELDAAYPVTFYGGATDERDARPVELKTGARLQADVTLFPVRALRVTFPAKSMEGKSLILMRNVFKTWPINSCAGMRGTMNTMSCVKGVAPGEYLAVLHRFDPQAQGEKRFWQGARQAVQVPVTIESDIQLDPDALIAQGATIKGILKLETDSPQPRSGKSERPVILFQTDDVLTRFFARVDENGAFETTVGPGTYHLQVVNARNVLVQDIVASGSVRVDGHNIVVGTGAGTLAFTASDRVGTIEGLVTEGGKPLSGAMVVLVPEKGMAAKELVRRDESDSDGTFSLPMVPDGKYTLLALKRGWEMRWAEPGVLDPYMKGGVPVEIIGTAKKQVTVNAQ